MFAAIHSRHKRLLAFVFGVLLAVGVVVAAIRQAQGCPFCSAAMQTLGQEIASADGAVIAQLAAPIPESVAAAPAAGAAGAALATAKFRIVEVLRGEEKLGGAKELDVVYFGQDPPEKRFLITGLAAITPDKIEWTTPVPLSDRAVEYVRRLPGLPASGIERLVFFQKHLEDADPLLAQDAYDEFARAPYAEITALAPHMEHDRLIEWINDPSVGPSGRRLYLTMLGVCGQPEDVARLEKLLRYDYQLMKPGIAAALVNCGASGAAVGMGLTDEMMHADERRKKESLDALIACYLKLKGSDGLALVNEKFLGNPTVEYKNLHSAIMALRFHGEETDILPREKLLESMRLALDHKEFADQVIPDLTRWEDWEVMPRLVTMFKDSEKDDWIRQPVASYLLVAAEQPGEVGQRGQAALAELESLDAETVERARSLSAFSFLAKAASAPNGTAAPAADAPPPGPAAQAEAKPPAAGGANAGGASDVQSQEGTPAEAPAAKPRAAGPVATDAELPAPSKLKIIGVPILAALALLGIFAVLLRGTDPRSSQEGAGP
ncbi:MAG: hypothetical protein IT424_12690 [Pirellulales bacterium]|nr:hypothetical protein [Pirellulales bacterium]